jgi:hypothetical protein
MLHIEELKGYESPEIEIIEFEFEESIAASGDSEGAALFELWD